ncbi:Uncharacterised protein [Nocardia africana]|uniref:Uncharacterized protein n=1 Tax=Nocardia africana TaxID=134964 RepID=A0A378X4S3_9NOCA|nr:Uncharacterised protein [Nocardia africana]
MDLDVPDEQRHTKGRVLHRLLDEHAMARVSYDRGAPLRA